MQRFGFVGYGGFRLGGLQFRFRKEGKVISETVERKMTSTVKKSVNFMWQVGLILVLAFLEVSSATLSPTGINYEGQLGSH